MKVLICGAGQVGFNIARHLAKENNAVTVIDQSQDLIRRIGETLDVQGFVGHASNPEVLEKAGIRDADMIIAVTYADEVNMIACQVAHSLFGVPTKIARIRQQSYLEPIYANLFSPDHLPIDVVISPEIEVARSIARRLKVPGALEMIPLVDDKVRLVGVRCGENCPIVNTPLRQLTQLFPDLNIVIVGIMRDGKAMVPAADDSMLPGDEAYFVVETTQLARAMSAFGQEESQTRRLLIFGGGNVGVFLAQEIEHDHPWIRTKIVEANAERAERAAGMLKNTVVLRGDVLDADILAEAGVGAAETVIAVTNNDETNILSCLLAKSHGNPRTIALVNKLAFEPLVTTLGIDVVVVPRNITVSTILQHVRRGRIHAAHALREGFGELIEAEAMATSPLVGPPLKDVKLPQGVLIGAIVREGTMIYPRSSTVIEPKDRIILFAAAESVRKVEQMFSVQLEFF
ncbi:MAG: Trk system potassium transporter TrkA [Rhodospirillales bacterium]|nr:Trk system potassium transporter TrkA [Rhodospirillales bacterium]MSP80716.1 Trk system potassium transporter TrkA [Rhodospirillales bacterium]